MAVLAFAYGAGAAAMFVLSLRAPDRPHVGPWEAIVISLAAGLWWPVMLPLYLRVQYLRRKGRDR